MSSNPSQAKNSGAGKAPAKSIPPTDSQSKKQRKRRGSTSVAGSQFRSAIKKCLKETSPDGSIKITEKTLCILCQIAHTLISDVTHSASELAKMNSKETIGVDDMVAAFELMLSGELRQLCIREIRTVINKALHKTADIR